MWRYHNPVRLHFGTGAFDRAAELIAGRRYATVSYDAAYFEGLTGRLSAAVGPAVLRIANIAPNPNYAALRDACARLAEAREKPEVIIAIGGGSVIDAAKVLAVGGKGFDAVKTHLETGGAARSLPEHAVPLIAIPTTAGTGSEVTSWATVWDTEAAKKYSLARDDLYPTDAIVDPALMLSLPRDQTISTGLDALSHALESLWNINANPVSTNFAIAAARGVMAHLEPLVSDLGDLALRGHMAQAATLAGLAFSNTKTALAHSLSYPATLHHGIPHGIACSFTLPAVMQSAIGASPPCDDALRQIFGNDLDAGVEKLVAFLSGLGIALDHTGHGIGDREWHSWLDEALDGERGQNFIAPRERVHEVFSGGTG
jgi:phosphonate metabolism-associated iron-containing alcohol dehydrogenase